MVPAASAVKELHGACVKEGPAASAVKECFLQFLLHGACGFDGACGFGRERVFFAVFAFFWVSCYNKQYFLGVLGRACGAQETSVGADAKKCTEGMMDGHDETTAVPRARIHDVHVVQMQKTPVPRHRPLLLV